MASQNKQVESMLEPWLELSNKVVMVTGASSGLGWEFCLDLAKAGCRIIAAARRIDRLKTLCDEINGTKPSQDQPVAVALELDIRDVFGRIDVLINNAGVREEWNDITKINQTGPWLVSKYVCTYMNDARQGVSLINISSLAALNRGQYHGGHAYSASNTALHAITKMQEGP